MSAANAKRHLKNPTTMAFIIMILSWVLSSLLIPGFNTLQHNMQFAQSAVYLGIIVIAQGIVIISGGIDLSVSSVVTLSSVICAGCVRGGMGTGTAIGLALLVSVLVGAFNATGIAFLRIPPIIMSIATISLIEGGMLIATNGTPPSGVSDAIIYMSKGTLIPQVPNVIPIYAVLVCAAIWFMTRTKWGRIIYAIGTNENATWLSGIGVNSMKYMIYCISSLFSGFAGIMILGYMGSTYLNLGTQYQLFSIAAVVIGGISIIGGKGDYIGIIAGTFLITIIRDVLTVAKISAAGREVFQGALILLIILAYGREARQR